ncbi:MAG: aspartate aminotransferase family protein [Hyphomonas sp.]|nr:aspartate aminotransferase family protein [Hyphomonas sp.]
MTAILHRSPGSNLPFAVAGEGVFLIDADGKRYLDGSGGAAVSCLGHGHPRIIEAIQRQAGTLAYAHTAFFTQAPAEALAQFLSDRAPMREARVFFTSGGSEGVETALKLARQYHVARGDLTRTRFISRRFSYHGATLGALSVSGHAARRAPYEPILSPCRFITPCYPYREAGPDEDAAAFGQRVANELEAAILEDGPETIAAFIVEPVVGATLGAVEAVPGYLARIREICSRHGVLMIADEVMCGMGRTGTLFACAHDTVQPDILVVAKGLAGGYQPIGAVLMSGSVYDAVTHENRRFEHGHTYIGHAIACAAAHATQHTIEEEGLLDAVVARGHALRARLADALTPLGIVGEIRGRGLLTGVELVEDPATKTPFPKSCNLNARVKQLAFKEGLIVYPGGGSAGNGLGDHILIAPPYIISEDEVDCLVERLTLAVKAALPVPA